MLHYTRTAFTLTLAHFRAEFDLGKAQQFSIRHRHGNTRGFAITCTVLYCTVWAGLSPPTRCRGESNTFSSPFSEKAFSMCVYATE